MERQAIRRVHDDRPEVVPVLVRPVVRLRSPVLDPPRVEPLPSELLNGRPSLGFPSSDAIQRVLWIAMLAATPALVLFGWQAAILVGMLAAAAREIDGRLDRATGGFADGFLPYRADDGWPRGVQEDDDLRWHWTSASFTRTRSGQGASG